MMILGHLLPFFLAGPPLIVAMKTSIYIDQIPLYSKLPECAMERMSAIVRAQASGCGDDQQLTSFSCFCIDQSSMMSSVISTAVEDSCAANATATVTSSGTPPEVTSAIEVFDSYCAKSTELSWYQNNSTSAMIITEGPTSKVVSATITATSTPTAASSRNTVPIAAIAAPVVIGVIAIAAVVGVLFYLRRKRGTKSTGSDHEIPPQYGAKSYYGGEMAGDAPAVGELKGSAEKYRYELENREVTEPVELEGRGAGGEKNLGEKRY
ncbi:hypothetical protein K458DRAFT_398690 [Lentithecium fluviatile CBS 122367]|uniref:Extracellular membrane protein CFEM domain-containing protein n=1 Tax=Lentithecium fluviatile CBS 122367 TaxID=1168545 RepID=A0A6G1JKK8_9PLEO|nr:hypothetical protein K458DRAFT_398690 [Lentithecium fluviatile CBS 122367]